MMCLDELLCSSDSILFVFSVYFVDRAMHSSGMEDLLLYLASSDDERQFSFHILEIVSLMFREQVNII